MKMKKHIKLIIMVFVIMIFGLHLQSDDKELFMGQNVDDSAVKPNVVILMDSSGSMNTVIFYPMKGLDRIIGTADDGYDPNVVYTGWVEDSVSSLSSPMWMARWITNGNAERYQYTDLGNNWTGCYGNDGTPNNFCVGSNGANYFHEGERILYRNTASPYTPAVATIKRKYIAPDSSGSNQTWFELEYDGDPNNFNPATNIVGGPIVANSTLSGTIYGHFQRSPDGLNRHPVIIRLWGGRDVWGSELQCQYEDARYPYNYLQWMFIHATDEQRETFTHFSYYGTYDKTQTPDMATTPSECDKGNLARMKQLWTRIQVAREVMCWLARAHSQSVMLGLFKFDPAPNLNFCWGGDFDPAGGSLVEGLGDMSDIASLVDFLGKIWAVKANSWTPLAEALVDVWYYIKPGPASKTYWPVDMELEAGTISVSNSVSDIEYWCQNNYVIIMTDGESTRDDFDGTKYLGSMFTSSSYPAKREVGWENWSDGWGDTDSNDPIPANYNPSTATYCPNNTCWQSYNEGTDYLDDVAYFLRHQDLFPDKPDPSAPYFSDDPITGWPSDQKIFTYTIGFNVNNHLLQETALNGDGGYYTADNYDELKEAFQNVITSINLRNFAFSSITAPKKTATATNTEQTISYVGYFLPSQAAPIWEGHLLAFELVDKWGFDSDDEDEQVDAYIYDSQEECLNNSGGNECYRSVYLSIGQEWDAADHIPLNRNLFTNDNSMDLIEFDAPYLDQFKAQFGPAILEEDAQKIVNKIRSPQLADIFHSDVGFVGPPPYGKQFVSNLNPTGEGDQMYADFYAENVNRTRVLYVGTNDGIMHMFNADGTNGRIPGEEKWGLIPDEVLPSLTRIVLDKEHTYTVDGRLSADDIYYVKEGNSTNSWATLLIFGFRRGGNAYYGLDITTVDTEPNILWKFEEPNYSGQSWGKAQIGRVRINDPSGVAGLIDKWVTVLPGGFEFNSNNPTDLRGKAVFVVDAATGELIWMIGYSSPIGEGDAITAEGEVPTSSDDTIRYLTTADEFNFSIPSSILAVDKDNNGYLDTIYFGNVGGHFFKTEISNYDTEQWKTRILFKDYIPKKGPANVVSVAENIITIDTKPFVVGDGIMGQTSYATGYITAIDNKTLTVSITSGTFQEGETIVSYSYDPIYLSPAAAFDTCYQLWITFGTGDRDRPRSNPSGGRYIAFKDNGAVNFIEDDAGGTGASTLRQLLWGGTDNEILSTTQVASTEYNGWFFNFPDSGEKMFDPEPIIIPDENLIPHIYFNTYQPPPDAAEVSEGPCDMPLEGIMVVYDIAITSCGTLLDGTDNLFGDIVAGGRTTGRIAGGGIYAGKEYVIYTSSSGDVADVPGGEGGQFAADPKRLPYPGGLVFWKEKKR